MKFDGTIWVIVGSAGFSAGIANYASLAFTTVDSNPYIAYTDGGNANKTTVRYYDASLGISELRSSKIAIYPDPSTNQVTIETSEIPTQSKLSTRDLNGPELITRQITEPKTTIDISNLISGIYFVRLTGDRSIGVGKLLNSKTKQGMQWGDSREGILRGGIADVWEIIAY